MAWSSGVTTRIVARLRRVKRRYRNFRHRHRVKYLVDAGLQIGEGSRFAANVTFGTSPYLLKIGNHVDISSRVSFITHDGADHWFSNQDRTLKYRDFIEVKDDCFIGVGAIVLPGVTIGPRSIVGAGSVITRDVPSNTVVFGNPAREVCSVDLYLKMKERQAVPMPTLGSQSKAQKHSRVTADIERVRAKKRDAQVGR